MYWVAARFFPHQSNVGKLHDYQPTSQFRQLQSGGDAHNAEHDEITAKRQHDSA
jgi:hypothetical protein